MAIGLLLLRVVVGSLLVGHGVQKLFGWLKGLGIGPTAAFMRTLRYRSGRVAAIVAGVVEALCGILILVGLFMPVAAAGIIGSMLNAIVTVHLRHGLWNATGGMELPLLYAVVAASLAFTGPGAYSLDELLGLELSGPRFGVGAVVVGLVVGFIALLPPARLPQRAG